MDRFHRLINIWCAPKHPPIHTCFIFILCIVVFETDSNVHLSIPLDPEEQFYNYFGTAVSHFSTSHLGANLSGIILFGTLLEIVHGTAASIFVYWISAVSGVLAEAKWNTGNVRYTGASSGVYGFVGAYLSHILLNWTEAPLRCLWVGFLLLQGIEVGVLLLYDEEYKQTIAHFSHLIGFVQGICVGLITLRNLRVLRCEIWLQCIGVVVSATIIIVSII
ncbi:MAG: hypothetical protein CMI56_00070 [Parcubacteria group bacterium]|nr:hypothetical protein [Parcubacteria group bacterium]|tara:strand:- start:4900 stop:5559 length:660 start_codon:yes stop_codon:yes gene_type:complete